MLANQRQQLHSIANPELTAQGIGGPKMLTQGLDSWWPQEKLAVMGLVEVLGRFPLPVEVIPMAAQRITRQFAAMRAEATLRMRDGAPLVTDNGQHILDVRGLAITDPPGFESEVNQWPGVVTVGVFAHQKASICLLGTAEGVKTINY